MEADLSIRNFYDKNNINITVIGELEEYDQIDELEECLNENIDKIFNITFLGANIIHRRIIDKLFMLQMYHKCHIFVIKRYLFSYLQGLGIKCSYLARNMKINDMNHNLLNNKSQRPSIEEIGGFLQDINNMYGYDYREYQLDSILRRINVAMIRERIFDFNIFRKEVINNQEIFYNLFLDFSINTTEFFRDYEVFYTIKNKILSYLNSYNHIKIWCAGCSIGKEAYSLAIMLQEANMLSKTQIYATDINPYVIEEARNGLYSINTLEKDINNYRNAKGEKSFIQYFKINKNYIKVKKELRKNMLFFQHSLLSDGRLNEFNLILCRNVFIYFNNNLQEKILKNFYNSLDNNGFLVLGKSESISKDINEEFFYDYDMKNKIYRKINK